MVFSMNHSSKLIKCGLCSRLYNKFPNPRLVIDLLPKTGFCIHSNQPEIPCDLMSSIILNIC